MFELVFRATARTQPLTERIGRLGGWSQLDD